MGEVMRWEQTHASRAILRVDGIGGSGRCVVGCDDIFQVTAAGDGGAHRSTGFAGGQALVAVALFLFRARGFRPRVVGTCACFGWWH